jgi:hypothetical protein
MSKKRDSVKFKGLNKTHATRVRKELIDFDYIDKLSETEKLLA